MDRGPGRQARRYWTASQQSFNLAFAFITIQIGIIIMLVKRFISLTSQRFTNALSISISKTKCFTTAIQDAEVISERSRGAIVRQQQREMERLEGNLQRALENYQSLISKDTTTINIYQPDSTSLIGCLHSLRDCYEDLEYWDEALRIEEEIREHILKSDEQHPSNKNEDLASSSYRIGKFHHRQEKWQTAYRFYQDALDLHTDSMKKGQVYISLAGIYFHRGDYHKALKILEEQADPCFTSDDMGLLKCFQHKGLIHRTLEDFEAALHCYQNASAILEKQEAAEKHLKQELDLDLADMLAACDQHDEAITLYRRILERCVGDGDTAFEAVILHNIGKSYAKKGDMNEAVEHLSRALELKESWLGEFHPEVGKTLSALGAVFGVTKEKPKAMECFHRALLIARMHAEEEDPEVLLALRNIAILKGSNKDAFPR